MEMEVGSNELGVDLYENDCRCVVCEMCEKETTQSQLFYLTERYV